MGRIKRRSGNAFVEYMELIDWRPEFVVMAGVGGNHEETAVMREKWGEGFLLFGYEPAPAAYAAARNTFPGIIDNIALWSHDCNRPLYTKPRWMDGSSMFESGQDQAERRAVDVTCRALDTLLAPARLARGGALWLDCEGAELKVLEGAEKFIEKVDVVNVEMTSKGRGPDWARPGDVHAWLAYRGFRPMFIHTIRPCIGQRDAIYGRGPAYHPGMTHIFG